MPRRDGCIAVKSTKINSGPERKNQIYTMDVFEVADFADVLNSEG